MSNNNGSLNLGSIFKTGTSIYKSNFISFIKLSLLSFLISVYVISAPYILKFIKAEALASAYNLFNTILIILLTFYISYRIAISIYIIAREAYFKKRIFAKEAFVNSRDYFWSYLGASISLFFALIIPLGMIMYSHIRIQSLSTKFLVYAIGLIPLIYFGTKYSFVPLSVILEKNSIKRFSYSNKLVKGSFFLVLCAFFLGNFVFYTPYYILSYSGFLRNQPDAVKYLASLLNSVITIFALPFSCCIEVVLFNELRKRKMYRQ